MSRLLVALLLATAVSAQTPTLDPDSAAAMRAAREAYEAHDCVTALARAQDVMKAAPAFFFAHNIAAYCALEQRDYSRAIAEFKSALAIQSERWTIVAGLIEAYALAGMTQQRDAERDHYVGLQRNGRAPAVSFIRDAFLVGDKRVRVTEFGQLFGDGNFRYIFNVYDPQARLLERIALESDAAEQDAWAEGHRPQQAAGQRKFSLDLYRDAARYLPAHRRLRDYNEGEPATEAVVADVKNVISGGMPASGPYALAAHPAALGHPPAPPTGVVGGVVLYIPRDVLDLERDLEPPTTASMQAGSSSSDAHPALSPPPPAGVSRVHIGRDVAAALLDRQTRPVYPQTAKTARIQGNVLLQATIDRDGNVASLSVISGPPMLTQAALDAVRQWHYKPYLLNGKPVGFDAQVIVSFSLSQ